jgi:hypothetical protein
MSLLTLMTEYDREMKIEDAKYKRGLGRGGSSSTLDELFGGDFALSSILLRSEWIDT